MTDVFQVTLSHVVPNALPFVYWYASSKIEQAWPKRLETVHVIKLITKFFPISFTIVMWMYFVINLQECQKQPTLNECKSLNIIRRE
jgi:hypothetical protein